MKTRSSIPSAVQAAVLDDQLELGISSPADTAQPAPRQRRSRPSSAGWWFARMRAVVAQARGWHPALSPRPEQIYFSNTHRQILLSEES